MVTLTISDFDEWRQVARQLLARETPPSAIAWLSASHQPLPFAESDSEHPRATRRAVRVPRAFAALAEVVALHRSQRKWDVLYRLLWRITHDSLHVLDRDSDDEVRVAKHMASQVRRDEHKMHAFVRFTPIEEPTGTRYIAWYEPDHLIVRLAAPFFADRFASMHWSILTPDLCAQWDGTALTFSPGVEASSAQRGADHIEDLWRTYYQSTFNAARVNPRAMQREMPVRRWRNLPEASLIPRLLSTAHERTTQVAAARTAVTARAFLPPDRDLTTLRTAAPACRGCDLYAPATQVVFGEGPQRASLVLVGEQPGDAEDLSGRPFVGPAGQVLDRALIAAGIDRAKIYLTNAVKHFSFEPRGKRRIHQTPRLSEMHACRPWLEAELQAIEPVTVVAMGSTAARALLGPQARVLTLRGRVLEGLAWAARVVVTVHPSAVLRSEGDGDRYFNMLVSDLALAAAPR